MKKQLLFILLSLFGITSTTSYAQATCGNTFTDSGGPTANYANNTNQTVIICPETPGEIVTVTFTEFNTETGWDALYVYDGNSTASPQISSSYASGNVPGGQSGGFWGTAIPGPFTSTDPSGCLTFKFRSDGSNNLPGWIANVICGPMPTCPAVSAIFTSNMTASSALISFTNNGPATSWEIIAMTCGTTPSPAAIGTITSANPYTMEGLNPNTCYAFYVRAICANNEYSAWNSTMATTSLITQPVIAVNTTQYTPEELITNVLVNNPCVSISNVTSSTGTNFGSVNGIGHFSNPNSSFPLSSGIVLSTGNALNVPGPNESTLSDGLSAWPGDNDLNNIILEATGQSANSLNASKLEFDFSSPNEMMTFEFLFASEEYGTFQCAWADSFAFLLTDLETGITTNLAVVPNTTTPISVVTIRDSANNAGCTSVNPEYFGAFYGPNNPIQAPTNFNGQTIPMLATSSIIPNHPYHIKLVIADRTDSAFDSAVFIQAGSFQAGQSPCNDKIKLVAFVDANNNGVKDTNELDFIYGAFVYQQNNTGNIFNVVTPFGTHYIYDENPSNTYNVSFAVNPEYNPYYSSSTVFTNLSIPAGSGTQTVYFPVSLTQGYNDVTVAIITNTNPRPGFNYNNTIVYKNLGLSSTSGTLTFVKDPAVTIIGVTEFGVTNNATGFTFNYANLQPYETRAINVTMSVPTMPIVNIADVLTNSANITTTTADIDPANNSWSAAQTVVASYDPNDITEAHGGRIQFDLFAPNSYLYYTIRFQNTGTAEAINVRLENTLDAQLNAESTRIVAASHDFVMERVNNQLVWKFNNINLIGATQDEELSKGYVVYKVKVNSGIAVGDIIPNTAEIYFDTNPPITTNTFNTEFVALLSNDTFQSQNILLFPNPATNVVQINSQNTTENLKSIAVYDVLGKKVKTITNIAASDATMEVSSLAKGVYLIEITSENNLKLVKKLVIQ